MDVLMAVCFVVLISVVLSFIIDFLMSFRRKTYLCIQEFTFANEERRIVVKKIKAKNETEAEMIFKHLTKEKEEFRYKGIAIQEWKYIKTDKI